MLSEAETQGLDQQWFVVENPNFLDATMSSKPLPIDHWLHELTGKPLLIDQQQPAEHYAEDGQHEPYIKVSRAVIKGVLSADFGPEWLEKHVAEIHDIFLKPSAGRVISQATDEN